MKPETPKKAAFLESFAYAFAGIRASSKGRNFRVQACIGLLAIILAIVLKISLVEWAVVVLCIGTVLSGECMNTALEALVDLSSPDYHPLTKIAKDCAAGAVLVLSFASFIIALLIFLPKILS